MTAQPERSGRAAGGARILLDCRWLGSGGAGRVTELLLRDLQREPPAGTWLLWGDPDRIRPMLFPGATIVEWHGRPDRWFGQADLLRVPPADVAIYLHQIRPLRPGPSITFIHDTIPVRLEPRRLVRGAKRVYLQIAARLSSEIITVSEWSRQSIVQDLRIAPRRIHVAALGLDPERARRLVGLRARAPRRQQIIYVGRFARHKNLRRLSRAFQRTEFRAAGGTLLLVGGSTEEVAEISAWLTNERLAGIQIRGQCPDEDLDDLLATARALVLPSIEEGYGLPAVEAASVGLPVIATRTGYAPTIPADRVVFADPFDEEALATAIDAALARPEVSGGWTPPSNVGGSVLEALGQVLRR